MPSPAHSRLTPRFGGVRAARGASLVEVLVASLVLAAGVVATSVLFLHGMQANRSALLRSEAVHLAADLAERIRADPLGRAAYAGGASGPGASGAAEFAQWRQLVDATLPAPVNGTGRAQVRHRPGSAVQPERFRIELAWSEPGHAAVWSTTHVLDLLPAALP